MVDRVNRTFAAAVRVLAVVSLTLLIYVKLFEHRFIYYPTQELTSTPSVAYESVGFDAADGARLHGWFIPAGEEQILIVSHGNGGNIGHRVSMAEFLHEELQIDILMYDYRGYGRSEGEPSEEGTYADIRGAYAYLLSRGYGGGQIYLLGQSLGAAVSVDLAAELEVGGVLLEAPFTSVAAMARRQIYIPVGWLLRTKYDSLSKVGEIIAPLAIVHARNDPIVPFHFGGELFDAATTRKRFFAVDDEVHEGVMMALGPEPLSELKRFIFEGDARSR